MIFSRRATHRHPDIAETNEAPPPAPSRSRRTRSSDHPGSPTHQHPHHQRHGRGKLPVLLFTGGFTVFCVFVTWHVLQSVLLSQRAAYHIESTLSGDDVFNKKTLSFDVCNGVANQRLSLLYGIILAFELGRAAVLPNFVLSAPDVTMGNITVPMSDLYDVDKFIASVTAVGVEAILPQDRLGSELSSPVDISQMLDPVEELQAQHKGTSHLHVGCPLFKLPSYYFSGANHRIMWAVLDALVPNKKHARAANSAVRKLRGLTHMRSYNFLHLRTERDWVKHCHMWEATAEGKLHRNCMNNTDVIDQMLISLNVPSGEPLYVSTNWDNTDTEVAHLLLGKLNAAGYQVVTSRDMAKFYIGGRESQALIDYEVALGAHKLVGNSVSTFTALALFQRRHQGKWSSYYNGGDTPLSAFLPMDLLPWVFPYSSHFPEWDYLIKAAVKSAAKYQTLQPYCMWTGNRSSYIYGWLQEHGVQIIHHDKPSWADDLWQKAEMFKDQNAKVSHIFSSKEALVEDFKRIDVPVLPELEQYVYILFTEPDIFFYKKVSLASFPNLPELVAMASDPGATLGVDGGVMLINAPAARETYEEFKLFILSNRRGGHFPQYGIGAVGAYVAFYESYIRQQTHLSPHHAAKPFNDYDVAADIVHFQGPKPHEYLHFFKTLECGYGQQCRQGWKRSLCQYAKKWRVLLNETEDEVALTTWYACLVLYAPHLKSLAANRIAFLQL